jgi:membrane protease subunit HflK
MAWNEPGSGGRDPWSQGPGGKRPPAPDFNELLARLRARLGGARGSSGASLALIAALGVGLWLLAGFYTVDEQERAAVIRCGAYARTVGPGLHWHLPPPFEHVRRVNVAAARQASVQGEMMTKDQNLVDVGLTVQFRVSSVTDYLFKVYSPDDTLTEVAKSALQAVVADYDVDAVLGEAQSTIAAKVRDRLQQTLDDYSSGLLVTDVSLSKAEPPDAVKAAFADAIKAAQDQKAARNEAQAYAAERLPKARGDAARSLAEAQAYRDQVIARAQGEAARFTALLQQYRKAPQLTRKRLYLETMSEIYAGLGKVLVDTDKSAVNLTVPLAPLLGAAASANAAAEQPSAPPPPVTPPTRGEDSGRSRDRGKQ